jgi:hypothetical protein
MNGETYRARIERKLTQAFSPVALEIRVIRICMPVMRDKTPWAKRISAYTLSVRFLPV